MRHRLFCYDIFMCPKIKNFLNAIAPLTKSKSNIGELLIISFIEDAWSKNKELNVNDIVNGIKNYSSASVNRKLKQLKQKKILSFDPSVHDERVKIIKKGLNYSDYLDEIDLDGTDVLLPRNHAQLP